MSVHFMGLVDEPFFQLWPLAMVPIPFWWSEICRSAVLHSLFLPVLSYSCPIRQLVLPNMLFSLASTVCAPPCCGTETLTRILQDDYMLLMQNTHAVEGTGQPADSADLFSGAGHMRAGMNSTTIANGRSTGPQGEHAVELSLHAVEVSTHAVHACTGNRYKC